MTKEAKAEDDEDLSTPRTPRMKRITVNGHVKPVVDRNNRFSALARPQDKREASPVRALGDEHISTSRRSSVRRTANPKAAADTISPSPLRNVAAPSSRAQGLSTAFPALPTKGTPKFVSKPKAAHPPAHLTPIQVATCGTPDRVKMTAPMRYADLLRDKLK